ncbi:restriction endonuclease subunit S [Methanimicrococcus hacksteinii]|uniref:restriction endonuclease subunit S n=1 Tax=Methanimicrococcus hacksteinii TaxID=3028293 RepID=UPI00298EE509|nr:restriction endonuclease subunit S [Methanimicrococcus sp. At1]
MTEWKKTTLEDICIKITDGSHFSPKEQQTGYPMYSVKDMDEYGFDQSKCKLISENDFLKMVQNDCVPQQNDVLVAKDGSYLKHIFLIKEQKDEAVLSSIAIFRPDISKIEPIYLVYILKNPITKQIISDNYVSGSALPRIVLKDFKKIELLIPPLSEQKKIAYTLSTLDNKIELNNQINDYLAS